MAAAREMTCRGCHRSSMPRVHPPFSVRPACAAYVISLPGLNAMHEPCTEPTGGSTPGWVPSLPIVAPGVVAQVADVWIGTLGSEKCVNHQTALDITKAR